MREEWRPDEPEAVNLLDVHEPASPLDSSQPSPQPSPQLSPQAPRRFSWAGRIRPRAGPRRWLFRTPWSVAVWLAVIKFFIVLSGTMIMLPFFRVLEDAFCHQHKGDTSPGFIDEKECKGDEIQKDLAFLLGWLGLLGALVGVLVALPYGALADKIGRKPVLLLSYGTMAFSFATTPLAFKYLRDMNLYYMLLGVPFQAVGGGIPVSMAMLYAIAADVTSEEERGTSFLLLGLGATVGGLIGPLVSGLLMERYNPWVPIYVVAALSPIVLASMAILPETLKKKLPGTSVAASSDAHQQTLSAWAKTQALKSATQVREALSIMKSRPVRLILAAFFINNPLMAAYTTIMVQYVSKQFGWDIAETSYLLSPLGLLNVIVLGALPKLSGILTSPSGRFRFNAFRKDALLTRISLVFMVLGALIEGISGSVSLFVFGLFVGTFGAAHSPLARALLTHYVDAKFTSRLMAVISIVETMGSFFGGPVLAVCFKVGQDKGGAWTGLPFFYIAGLCGGALVCLLIVRPPPEKGDVDTDRDAVGLDEPGERYVDEEEGGWTEERYADDDDDEWSTLDPDAPLVDAR